jgi:hypothetical protein
MGNKQCRKCGEADESKLAPGRNLCRTCWNARHRAYLDRNPDQKAKAREGVRRWQASEHGVAYQKKKSHAYHLAHQSKRNAFVRAWRTRLWERLLDIYGRECVCCGFNERLALVIDHVNNNGHQDRAQHGGHRQLYFWLSNQPKLPDYQILCANCNTMKQRNQGVCPHETERGELA